MKETKKIDFDDESQRDRNNKRKQRKSERKGMRKVPIRIR